MSPMSKVLLVEDDDTTNFISKMVLKSAGVQEVDEVGNGQLACDYISNDCPDFIFLDISMPVMDGWTFLEEKKKNGGLCPNVKIAMLTSSVRSSDMEKASTYPCVIEYIEKPLTEEKIQGIMDKLAS